MKRTTVLILFLFAIAANPVHGQTSGSLSSVMKEYREAAQLTNLDAANARLSDLVNRLERMDAVAGKDEVSSTERDEIRYIALVKIALNKISQANSLKDSSSKNIRDDALDHLYKAAVLNPRRPEAFICLAWLRQERGEDPSWYVNKAKYACKNEPNVDVILLEGRLAEMTGNYASAALTYAKALQPSFKYSVEPLFITRFKTSVERAQTQDAAYGRMPKYYWVPDVYEKFKYGDDSEAGKKQMSRFRARLEADTQRIGLCTSIQDDHLYRILLNQGMLRSLRTYPHIRGYDSGYRFSQLFDFKIAQDTVQAPDEKPRKLAAAFLAASADMDEAKLSELEIKWDRIEAEAKRVVDSTADPKIKAKKLFDWVKDNVLQEYNIQKGFTGKQVVESQKYFMCMTGAVTYTLLAQSVGLDAKGVVIPGHALAAVDCSDKRYLVETTVPKDKKDSGFNEISKANSLPDIRNKYSEMYRKAGGLYFLLEEIMAPSKMTALQYQNLSLGNTVTLFKTHSGKVIELLTKMPKETLAELQKESQKDPIPELSNEFILELVNNIWPEQAHQKYPALFRWVLETLTYKYPGCQADLSKLEKSSVKMRLRGLRVDPGIAENLYKHILVDLIHKFDQIQRIEEGMVAQINALPYSEKMKDEQKEQLRIEAAAYLSTTKDAATEESLQLIAELRKLDREKGKTIPNSPFRKVYGEILKMAVLTDQATMADNIISEIVAGAEIKPGSQQQ
jgi:hypothetical protein